MGRCMSQECRNKKVSSRDVRFCRRCRVVTVTRLTRLLLAFLEDFSADALTIILMRGLLFGQSPTFLDLSVTFQLAITKKTQTIFAITSIALSPLDNVLLSMHPHRHQNKGLVCCVPRYTEYRIRRPLEPPEKSHLFSREMRHFCHCWGVKPMRYCRSKMQRFGDLQLRLAYLSYTLKGR